MELKNAKINFLGDSITEGYGTSAQDKIYLNVLAKQEGLAAARNYGVGGTRIARQHQKSNEVWDEDYLIRAQKMDPDADAVVVFGGTNDFGHGDAPLGHMQDRTPETFYGACHCLIRYLLEKYPHALIVFMTPTHRADEYGMKFNNMGNRICGELIDYVNIILEVAAYYSIPVLDLYRNSGISPEITAMREAYMPDGLHPNDSGHAIIARKLAAFLKQQ